MQSIIEVSWSRILPDVWCVAGDVVLCPWIELVLCALDGWADPLIFCP